MRYLFNFLYKNKKQHAKKLKNSIKIIILHLQTLSSQAWVSLVCVCNQLNLHALKEKKLIYVSPF